MNIEQSVFDLEQSRSYPASSHAEIKHSLREQGWILLRHQDYDVQRFSELMTALCQKLTYDPARENITQQSQKVDAGTQAVGLHIENGTTPLPPDMIAFFSEVSASQGSQTTVCDGHAVYNSLSEQLKQKFAAPMTISRYLPKQIWQKYVATALNIAEADNVTWEDLNKFIQMIPGQAIIPAHEGGVEYHLQMNMIRHDNLKGVPAFANTILGPSYNYQKPKFTFADGREISQELIAELVELCEQHTQEIDWQDGDVAIIDNKRLMHGRREILVPLEQRKLYISMGLGLNQTF
ncbi:TauD/TfdA family dioxygenase [Acinetobacter kanungonis]|uniref:TauD/TfdA family dioxygenase n=1 Tax=Acinetobacter kanungonis TaxID=2699469 RepID=UPI00137A001F|nr:TauD/TfdA family dioxygenase [Acinetobacter kanungonis]NCI79434.1 TauD/TfdA family dioxygenase [Acinetobacter kanungonis]